MKKPDNSEKRSIVFVLAAFVLIGVSFLVRKLLTGSWLDVYLDILKDPGNFKTAVVFAISCATSGCVFLFIFAAGLRLKLRRGLKYLALLTLCLFPIYGLHVGVPFKQAAFIPERSQALIQAIQRYQADTSRLPRSLSDLQPHYIEKIPETGFGRNRGFIYLHHGTELHGTGEWLLGDSPWALMVELVPGGTLLYRSDHNYKDIQKTIGREIGGGWVWTGID